MFRNLKLITLLFFSISSSITFAQDNTDDDGNPIAPSEKPRSFHVGLYMGCYFANNYSGHERKSGDYFINCKNYFLHFSQLHGFLLRLNSFLTNVTTAIIAGAASKAVAQKMQPIGLMMTKLMGDK